MKSPRITRYLLIFVNIVWLLPPPMNGQGEMIMDQAVSSAEVRRKLITEYENSPKEFHDDRLLAVAISYAVQNGKGSVPSVVLRK